MVARFLRREKRFLAICELNGDIVTAHTNNSGSMLGLLRPGSDALLSVSDNPKRKLAHTLEMLRPPQLDGAWVGVNTLTPNRLLRAAFEAGRLPFAQGYAHFQPEASLEDSRLDGLITGPDLPRLWVECKNVTLVEDEVAMFPDAVTERGQKHLRRLMAIRAAGERAALFFVVQRPDGHCFGPADVVDPVYAELLREAAVAGVEIWPMEAELSPAGVELGRVLPLVPSLAGRIGEGR